MGGLAASVSRFRFPAFLGVGGGNAIGKRVLPVFAVEQWRRGFHSLTGKAVSASRGLLHAVLAHQLPESGRNGFGSGRGALADLTLRERLVGIREHLDDALLGGFGLRRGLIGHLPPQPQGGSLALVGELDLDVVEAGSGAVLDGHDDLPVAAAQVEIAVAPGVQLRASPERLARSCCAALGVRT